MSGLTKVLSMVHNPQFFDIVDAFKLPSDISCNMLSCHGVITYVYEVLNLMFPSGISSICFPMVL
jgi:hypothetical protein